MSKAILIFICAFFSGCGAKSTSGNSFGEQVPLKEFGLSRLSEVSLRASVSSTLTEPLPPPDGPICNLERRRTEAERYFGSMKTYDYSCGKELKTGVRYRLPNFRMLARKIEADRVQVTTCFPDRTLYHYYDFTKSDDINRWKASGYFLRSNFMLDRYLTNENELSYESFGSTDQEDGIRVREQNVATISSSGVTTWTTGYWSYTPHADPEKTESLSRAIFKQNALKGMYHARSWWPVQEPPFDNTVETLFVDAATYQYISGDNDEDFQPGSSLFVSENDLPPSPKDLSLSVPDGLWDCQGEDEVIECEEKPTTPASKALKLKDVCDLD